jgi:hypothetical protein
MIVIIGLCKKEVYPIFYPSPIAFHQMLEYQKRKLLHRLTPMVTYILGINENIL